MAHIIFLGKDGKSQKKDFVPKSRKFKNYLKISMLINFLQFVILLKYLYFNN